MSYGTLTSNHQLLKPDQDDFYDIGVANDNMDIIDAALINYGPTEPPGSSFVWFKPIRTRLISDDNPNNVILQLSDNTGDGYYLNTGEDSKKIENIVENAEEAKPGDVIIMV